MEKRKFTPFLLLAALICCSHCFAGNLNPTSPPGSTMKTLDEVEPRIPISESDLPLTIKDPGSYYFAENIVFEGDGVGAGNAAISIETDNVTIDLMGFSLDGNLNSKSTAGIYSDRKCITVKNGQVKSFQFYCINIGGEASDNNTIEKVNAMISDYPLTVGRNSTIRQCQSTFARQRSIRTDYNCLVTDCVVANGGGFDGDGIFVQTSSIVSNCNVYIAKEYGIFAHYGSRVVDCAVYSSGKYGIYASDDTVVTGCAVRNCTGATAIHLNSKCLAENNSVSDSMNGLVIGYGSSIRANQVNDCTYAITAHNGAMITDNLIQEVGYGITVGRMCSVKNNHIAMHYSSGIIVNDYKNVIEGNTIISSSATGIKIVGDNNLYINNRYSNSTNVDNSGSGNDGIDNTAF
ncbi:MAG: NosD domain-containing protein [Sedimentisphaeraceae bacterium JB056]